jgi:hypothetical protein
MGLGADDRVAGQGGIFAEKGDEELVFSNDVVLVSRIARQHFADEAGAGLAGFGEGGEVEGLAIHQLACGF